MYQRVVPGMRGFVRGNAGGNIGGFGGGGAGGGNDHQRGNFRHFQGRGVRLG